ncbi:MAG: amidohydrolase [Alphaproteobacteria bacterium]|nr:amidohydrolase [Alphaproteobacteria bacterium]
MAFWAPDLALINGRILTMDGEGRIAEAMAVMDGRIAGVGTTKAVLAACGPKTRIVDLGGRVALPGLTDPHVHLADKGTDDLYRFDVRDFYTNVRSIPDILAQVKGVAAEKPAGTWLIGHGSPMQDLRMGERRFPDRWELDRVAPDHPVAIGFGAHITIVNSRALALAGIDRDTPDPQGGHIDHDPATGAPTGKLVERAQLIVRAAHGSYSYEEMKDGIVFAGKQCLERGITTVHDIVTNHQTMRAYQELARDGRLPVRTSVLVRIIEAAIQKESLLNLGIHTGFGSDWLKIGGVKMSIDGGITGQAAAFHEPYANNDCNCGLIRIKSDELDETVDLYHRAGHRVCIHAIGDKALDMALGALDKAITAAPRDDHRHRVEHMGNWLVTPDRLATVKRLGILPVPNIPFLHFLTPTVLECIGAGRLENSFNLKTLLAAGIPITSGSDGPGYWPVDILRDISFAVARDTWDGGVHQSHEALTLDQALALFTRNAAFNGFEEDIKGTLEPGKLADVAVLGEDPYAVAPERIRGIEVDMTIVDGRIAYVRDDARGFN